MAESPQPGLTPKWLQRNICGDDEEGDDEGDDGEKHRKHN
jgi:hypothetical protein